MRIELPELKKCCCCIPLRHGLLFWIYLKLALGVILLFFFIQALIRIIYLNSQPLSYILASISLIISTMEIVFCVLFLISAHRKNHEYMRIYYRYSIGMLVFDVITMLVFVGLDIYTAIQAGPFVMFVLEKMLEYNSILFVLIVLQAYLVILVRSEVLKLERNTKIEFINHTNGPECKAQIIP